MYTVADKVRVIAAKISWPAPGVKIPKGLFRKDGKTIADTLLRLHGGNVAKTVDSLQEYINRGGKDLPNKKNLQEAKKILKSS